MNFFYDYFYYFRVQKYRDKLRWQTAGKCYLGTRVAKYGKCPYWQITGNCHLAHRWRNMVKTVLANCWRMLHWRGGGKIQQVLYWQIVGKCHDGAWVAKYGKRRTGKYLANATLALQWQNIAHTIQANYQQLPPWRKGGRHMANIFIVIAHVALLWRWVALACYWPATSLLAFATLLPTWRRASIFRCVVSFI